MVASSPPEIASLWWWLVASVAQLAWGASTAAFRLLENDTRPKPSALQVAFLTNASALPSLLLLYSLPRRIFGAWRARAARRNGELQAPLLQGEEDSSTSGSKAQGAKRPWGKVAFLLAMTSISMTGTMVAQLYSTKLTQVGVGGGWGGLC